MAAPNENFPNSKYSDVVASILPKQGKIENFDFDLNLKTSDLGLETKELKVEGSGKYEGVDFTFIMPISHLKLQYHLGSKFNKDMQYDALGFEQDPFIVDV